MAFRILAHLAVLATFCAAPTAIAQQTSQTQTDTTALPVNLRAEILAVFPDDVSSVPRDAYDAMFAKTEAFFAPFEAAGEDGHARIRAAIVEDGHPNFFYYRAAGFLFDPDHANSPDAIAALAGLERVSPYTVNNQWYLMTANMMAVAGLDTGRLAMNWLEQPQSEITFDAGLHVFYYSPIEAVVYSSYYGNEAKIVPLLTARLEVATDPYEIDPIIQLLWNTMTVEGFAALRSYAADETKPDDARAYAREQPLHMGDGPPSEYSMEQLQQLRLEVVAMPWRHNSFEKYHAISDEMAKLMQ
jgi:hypothetical protein